MADAPFSLYVDIPTVTAITTASGTATVATAQPHGLVGGDYVQIEGVATTTAWNGVYQVADTPSGTQFRFTSATTGSADVTSAVASRNMLNPLSNYPSSTRINAVVVPVQSISMSKSGDGGSNSFGFAAIQDATPANGPWFASLPDNARVRLIKCNTTSVPSATESDVQFKGIVASISSQLNGGGQGTFSQVQIDDVNVILDKLTINIAPTRREIAAIARQQRSVIVQTKVPHGFTVGQKICFKGAIVWHPQSEKASAVPFNKPSVWTVGDISDNLSQAPAGCRFVTTSDTRFADVGASLDSKSWLSLTSSSTTSPASIRNDLTKITVYPGANVFHNLTSADVGTRVYIMPGNNGSGPIWDWLISNDFAIDQIITTAVGGGIVLKCLGLAPRPTGGGITALARLRGYPEVDLEVAAGVGEYIIGAQTSETAVIQQFFTKSLQGNYKYDATLKRLFDVTDTSGIATLSGRLPEAVTITADTLKSALDTVVEQYSGIDGLERRYWIGTDRKLYYKTTSGTASTPTYANAPLQIITSGPGSPEGTPSTIAPFDLSVESRHADIVKRAVVYPKTGSQVAKLYTETGYTARSGPILEARLDAPLAVSAGGIERAAKAFFLENSKPIVSGSLTLAGYSTASYNNYGFMGGIYQTGATAYATATSWQPGQYVSITAPSLSLSGLYRVETVDVSFEGSSFAQRIAIGFSRRPVGTLTDVLRSRK